MRRVTVTGLLLAAVLGTPALALSQTPKGPAALPPFIQMRTGGSYTTADERFLAEQFAIVQQRSPTFRDMVSAIGAVGGIRVLLAPRPELQRDEKLMGRTQLRSAPDGLVAYTDIVVNREHPLVTVEAIAHELGHAIEAACLGPVGSLDALRAALRARAIGHVPSAVGGTLETPFPKAVGRVVAGEWPQAQGTAGRFDALVREFGLARCALSNSVVARSK